MSIRIGQGCDVHAFNEPAGNGSEEGIVLGGVHIPFEKSLLAHSDGDVLLHAICDAILGALALGDIGQQFPDTDKQYADVDSRLLLRRCTELATENCYAPVNIDATIVAQSPRMSPYIQVMRSNIAADLKLDISSVSVKATTTEQLGFCGRGEGIICMAVALLST